VIILNNAYYYIISFSKKQEVFENFSFFLAFFKIKQKIGSDFATIMQFDRGFGGFSLH
jgi:hypothetical protein